MLRRTAVKISKIHQIRLLLKILHKPSGPCRPFAQRASRPPAVNRWLSVACADWTCLRCNAACESHHLASKNCKPHPANSSIPWRGTNLLCPPLVLLAKHIHKAAIFSSITRTNLAVAQGMWTIGQQAGQLVKVGIFRRSANFQVIPSEHATGETLHIERIVADSDQETRPCRWNFSINAPFRPVGLLYTGA